MRITTFCSKTSSISGSSLSVAFQFSADYDIDDVSGIEYFIPISRFPIQCGLRHYHGYKIHHANPILSVAFQFSADYDAFSSIASPRYSELLSVAFQFSADYDSEATSVAGQTIPFLSVAFQFSADYDKGEL